MTRLALRLAFSGRWTRPVLVACCTAVVSGLVLVAVAVLSLRGYAEEYLFSVAADPGTRGGYVLGLLLLAVPPLLLLHQAVRLGTAARERRLAALRLAGATPGEVRAIGALEVGVPAGVGAVLGIGVYRLLGALSGAFPVVDGDGYRVSVRLVPQSVRLAWWTVVVVALGVTALGVVVGLLANRRVVVSPLGVTRRAAPPPPRPWGAGLVLAGLLLGAVYVRYYDRLDDGVAQVAGLGCVVLLVIGPIALAPWFAYAGARAVAARAGSVPLLLAAQRLVAEPRPAARAGGAVGGIGLVAGGCAVLLADLVSMDDVDTSAYVALVLVGVALLAAGVAVVGSLSVHAVESLLDRGRSTAALVALGAAPDQLVAAQRWEVALVTLPMATLGVLFGSGVLFVAYASTGNGLSPWVLLSVASTAALVVALVWVGGLLAVRLVRPWSLRAADPAHLRTE